MKKTVRYAAAPAETGKAVRTMRTKPTNRPETRLVAGFEGFSESEDNTEDKVRTE
jgi:hypothetical protein